MGGRLLGEINRWTAASCRLGMPWPQVGPLLITVYSARPLGLYRAGRMLRQQTVQHSDMEPAPATMSTGGMQRRASKAPVLCRRAGAHTRACPQTRCMWLFGE